MGVSIRLPTYNTDHYHSPYARRRFLTPRFWSRKGVLAAFVVLVESIRLLSFLWSHAPSSELVQIDAEDLGRPLWGVTNLVIVSSHAIWVGGPSAGANESEWYAPTNAGRVLRIWVDQAPRGMGDGIGSWRTFSGVRQRHMSST
jgi:photosystem II stability/assembly factor-like uncharacterized protein